MVDKEGRTRMSVTFLELYKLQAAIPPGMPRAIFVICVVLHIQRVRTDLVEKDMPHNFHQLVHGERGILLRLDLVPAGEAHYL